MINLQTIAPTLNFCVILSNFLKTPANPAAWGKKITGNEKGNRPALAAARDGLLRYSVWYEEESCVLQGAVAAPPSL